MSHPDDETSGEESQASGQSPRKEPEPTPTVALPQAINALYKRVGEEKIQPGSFGILGLLPGSGKPTGYAKVIKKLSEARKALKGQRDADAERLYYQALTHYNWCDSNLNWINERITGGAIPIPIAGWLIGLIKLPRWLLLIFYLAAWVAIVAWLTQDHPSWELISVPLDYLFWGVLGGATAGVFGVWIHIVRGDFDPSYVPWYVAKPFMGGIAGALVFLMGDAVDIIDSSSSSDTSESREALLAAFVVGFFESLLITILEIFRVKIRDVTRAVAGQTDNEPASEAETS